MSIWGTLLGTALGLALGGPLGALVGALAGHFAVDRALARPDETLRRQTTFTIAVIALAAKLARSDGDVNPREWQRFQSLFKVPDDEAANVQRFFKLAQQTPVGYQAYARQISALFADDVARLETLLETLVLIARADGAVQPEELRFFDDVAAIFALAPAAVARLRAELTGDPLDDPYALLGVEADASAEDIRNAYHQLARKYHPDRQQARGVPPEFLAVVQSRMSLINAAYAQLRGLKAAA
jgi:DnaJ like chaperone protein